MNTLFYFLIVVLSCVTLRTQAFGFAEADNWHLVFRVSTGAGRSVYDLWTGSETTTWPPFVEFFNETRDYYYKHPDVEKWSTLKVKRIRLSFYNLGKPVMTLIFTGLGSTKNNWFEGRRLLYSDHWTESLVPKMFDQSATGVVYGRIFAMKDDLSHQERKFQINKVSGYTDKCGHVGWMVVVDHVTYRDATCSFGSEGHRPRFLFSPKPHPINWHSPDGTKANYEVAEASEMAIFLDY